MVAAIFSHALSVFGYGAELGAKDARGGRIYISTAAWAILT
jgi:hypothetical protein